jgi:hypothetical protein
MVSTRNFEPKKNKEGFRRRKMSAMHRRSKETQRRTEQFWNDKLLYIKEEANLAKETQRPCKKT